MNYFNFSKEYLIDSNIPKEAIYRNKELDIKTKDLIKDNIERMRIKYYLNSQNSNIEGYKDIIHDELNFISIELRKNGEEDKIIKLLHSFIPRGTILEVKYGDEIILSSANKSVIRGNKIMVEEVCSTPWFKIENKSKFIEALNFKKFNTTNLKEFYISIVTRIKGYKVIEEGIDFENIEKKSILLTEYLNLQKEIETLSANMKKENQLNRRVQLSLDLKRKKDELQEYKINIKES